MFLFILLLLLLVKFHSLYAGNFYFGTVFKLLLRLLCWFLYIYISGWYHWRRSNKLSISPSSVKNEQFNVFGNIFFLSCSSLSLCLILCVSVFFCTVYHSARCVYSLRGIFFHFQHRRRRLLLIMTIFPTYMFMFSILRYFFWSFFFSLSLNEKPFLFIIIFSLHFWISQPVKWQMEERREKKTIITK